MNEHLKKLKEFVNESSLARIWQFVEYPDKSFGILSAFRGKFTLEENEQRHIELQRRVRSMKLGFVELRGGFKEQGEEEFAHEKALFIPFISREQIIELGKIYDQDSVIYKGESEFSEIGTNSDTGIGNILRTYKKGSGQENLSSALQDLFSSLLKGSHADKRYLFTLERRQEASFNAEYGRRFQGIERKWFPVIESVVEIGED